MGGPSDAELRAGLEQALAGVGLELAGAIERRPSPYRTSFPIEELASNWWGGDRSGLDFKQLDWERLEPGAQVAKPRFLHDPDARAGGLPGAAAAGARRPAASSSARCWRPTGAGSSSSGSRDASCSRWGSGSCGRRRRAGSARFHVALAPELERRRCEARLIDHDAAFYRRWIERAREFAADPKPSRRGWRARHEQVVEALLALPRTVHPRRVLRFQRARRFRV